LVSIPGLRSPAFIRKGQFIDRYLGEVISEETSEAREASSVSNHDASYLFSLDFVPHDEMYVVDGRRFGSATRFMNHSCHPNCRIFPVTQNHGDRKLYDLAFFALQDIHAGTELTFDYNPGWTGKSGKVDPNAVKCLCGEKKCRGQLWPSKRKKTQRDK
jgi:histone-lysine N-methyltransferase SUV39H